MKNLFLVGEKWKWRLCQSITMRTNNNYSRDSFDEYSEGTFSHEGFKASKSLTICTIHKLKSWIQVWVCESYISMFFLLCGKNKMIWDVERHRDKPWLFKNVMYYIIDWGVGLVRQIQDIIFCAMTNIDSVMKR